MKIALLIAALFFSSDAYADTAAKNIKLAKLMKAQRLPTMLQEQIDETHRYAGDMGRYLFKQMLDDSGPPPTVIEPELENIYNRYKERAATIFTVKELLDRWAASYGKNLSEADLDKILAYYQSPIGAKDMDAHYAAMGVMFPAMQIEGKKRIESAMADMANELAPALKRLQEGKK